MIVYPPLSFLIARNWLSEPKSINGSFPRFNDFAQSPPVVAADAFFAFNAAACRFAISASFLSYAAICSGVAFAPGISLGSRVNGPPSGGSGVGFVLRASARFFLYSAILSEAVLDV